MSSKLKICDLYNSNNEINPNFDEDFLKSISTYGFAVINNHGISFDYIRSIQKLWQQFFKSSLEEKNLYVNIEDNNLGYSKFEKETAVGFKKPDPKEYFQLNRVSKVPLKLSETTTNLFKILEKIGLKLLYILGDNTDKFTKCCENSEKTIIRSIYYPVVPNSEKIRAEQHQDINMITLLVAATSPGLEILYKGEWKSIPYQENSIIVNIGDMLQTLSKGQYTSTTHRVVNTYDNNDRISIPIFIHCKEDTVLNENGLTAKKFLDDRLKIIHS